MAFSDGCHPLPLIPHPHISSITRPSHTHEDPSVEELQIFHRVSTPTTGHTKHRAAHRRRRWALLGARSLSEVDGTYAPVVLGGDSYGSRSDLSTGSTSRSSPPSRGADGAPSTVFHGCTQAHIRSSQGHTTSTPSSTRDRSPTTYPQPGPPKQQSPSISKAHLSELLPFHLRAVGRGAGSDEGQDHGQEHQPMEGTAHDDATVPAGVWEGAGRGW